MYKFKTNKIKIWFLFWILLIGGIVFMQPVNAQKNINGLFKERSETYQENEDNKNMVNNSIQFNIFKQNLESNQRNSIKKLLYWVQFAQKRIEENFPSCVQNFPNIATILYFSNNDFQKEIDLELEKKYIENFKTPQWKEYLNICNQISNCIQGSPSKLLSFDCNHTVNNFYLQGISYFENQENINDSNKGMDKYLNNSIEDSPFDILYDIIHIKKILFGEEGNEDLELIFYRTPLFASTQSSSQSSPEGGITSNFSNNSKNQESNWTEDGITTDIENLNNFWEKNQNQTIFQDSEINNFLEKINWTSINENNSIDAPFFVNQCDIPEGQDPLFLEDEILNLGKFSEKELEEYLLNTIKENDRIEQLKYNFSPQFSSEKWSSTSNLATNPEEQKNQLEDLGQCSKKCDDLALDLKLVCRLDCLCSLLISPSLPNPPNPFTLLEEWSFRLRFCTIPSEPIALDKGTKTLYGINSFIEEIYSVVKNLIEKWELSTRNRKREFLDSSLKTFKFSEITSFVFNIVQTPISNDLTLKKQQQRQETFDNINYTQSKTLNPALDNNQYILWWDHNERIQYPTPTEAIRIDTFQIQQELYIDNLLYKEKDLDYWLNIRDFLEKSAIFLEHLNNSVIERTSIINGVLEKPRA